MLRAIVIITAAYGATALAGLTFFQCQWGAEGATWGWAFAAAMGACWAVSLLLIAREGRRRG